MFIVTIILTAGLIYCATGLFFLWLDGGLIPEDLVEDE